MRILLFFPLLLLFDSLLRFALLCLRALMPDKRIAQSTGQNPVLPKGCVILIAAHDEAGTIGPTVTALKEAMAEWPNSSLWVVADRCTDSTAEEAEAAGAQVAARIEGKLGKGAVIAWWMKQYNAVWKSKGAVIILDADSRIAPGSLNALRLVMNSGADAAQAFVKPDASTRSGRLAGWSEVLMQRIDDEARRRCGWQVPLRGTGMALRGELLAELAPRLHTYAEDLELDVILASRGARVDFVPQAVIFDPKPQESAGASRQRARWLQGQLQVLRDYHREFTQALLTRGIGAWFLLWLLMLRPKVLFIGLRLLFLLVGLLLLPYTHQTLLPWLAFAGLAMDAIYYLAGAAIVDDPRRYLLDLLAVPRYVAMWFFSFGMAVIRRRTWLRAGR